MQRPVRSQPTLHRALPEDSVARRGYTCEAIKAVQWLRRHETLTPADTCPRIKSQYRPGFEWRCSTSATCRMLRWSDEAY